MERFLEHVANPGDLISFEISICGTIALDFFPNFFFYP